MSQNNLSSAMPGAQAQQMKPRKLTNETQNTLRVFIKREMTPFRHGPYFASVERDNCTLHSAQRPNLTGYPLLAPCSFAANYHLNFLPSSRGGGGGASVGRAMVICFGDRGFESRRGQRFFSFSMWALSFLGLALRRY